ncbi:MAG: hypothetical protein VYD68_04955, partial [Pseudomonadota bacterium]|nr:hypothetical protein [Pseudomonadota bacterium]
SHCRTSSNLSLERLGLNVWYIEDSDRVHRRLCSVSRGCRSASPGIWGIQNIPRMGPFSLHAFEVGRHTQDN